MRGYTRIGLIGLLILGLFCGGALAESAPSITSVSNDAPTTTDVVINYVVNQSDAGTKIAFGKTSALGNWSDWHNDSKLIYNITLPNLAAGTPYYYSVYAYNGTDSSYSNNSLIYDFITKTLVTSTATAPSITSVSNDTPTTTDVVINYVVNQSDAGTRIAFGKTSALGNWSDWHNDSKLIYNITLPNLAAGTPYYYSVYAYNDTDSSYSNNSLMYDFTTKTLVTSTATAPSIMSVSNDAPTATDVVINYVVNQSDAGTRIAYGKTSALGNWSDWHNDSKLIYNVTLPNLAAGTPYYYSVYAYNDTDSSYFDNSSIKSFTTLSESGDRIWEEGMPLKYTWDAKSYSGFYYDLDSGLGSETLTIELKSGSRTVDDGNLTYSTEPINTSFEYSDWGTYQIIGFMAERYFAGYHSKTFGSSDKVSLISDGQMSKVLMNEDEERSVYAGSALILDEGYTLNIVELDQNGDRVYVKLTKDGSEVDSMILSSNDDYTYEKDLGSADDVPIIAVHFDEIFSGAETSAVFVNAIFQISDEYLTIESGDSYGKMKVDTISAEKIEMSNDDSFSLNKGDTIDIMGKIKFLVADDDDDEIRFAPFVDMTEPGTYELRGTVADDLDTATWTPLNFEGFYYNMDDGEGTESLTVTRVGTKINDGDLVYTAKPVNVSFEYTDSTWKEYDVIGFMAEKYFAGYPSGTFGTDGISLISDGQLSKVLINEDKSRTIYSGSGLILDDGYVLNIVEVDINGDRVAVSLSKDGSEVDDLSVVSAGKTYVYEKDLGSSEDVPIIAVHFDEIFQGQETNAVFVDGIFQISDEYITVEDGDTYGEMKVISTYDEIVMKNDDDITLSKDKTISIMGDIKFKVADDPDVVRYYPFVEVNTAPNDALNISMTDTAKQGDSVTITVTSRGATINDAVVKFDDEDIGKTSNEGTITHTPDLSGKFTVTAEKEGYVSATGEIEVISLMDETKKISIEVSPDVVYEGDRIIISTIKSIGGETVEGVDVSYDGNSLGTTASDGTIPYTVIEPGMHKLIATKSGLLDAEHNLEVLAHEAKFEFSNLVISPLEVKAGKDVTITLNASNTGTADGDYNVDLMINGNLTESRQVTLAMDESTTIEFTVAKDEPGTYLVEVHGLSGDFEVLEKGGVILYVLGLLGAFAAAAVVYMFTAGGWTIQMVSEKVAGFIASVR